MATTVLVSPAALALTALEETLQLTAEVRHQNGQVMTGAALDPASSWKHRQHCRHPAANTNSRDAPRAAPSSFP